MKIYFSGSIRGGREDVEIYSNLIEYLKKYGEVLTAHVGDKNIKVDGEENGLTDEKIHNRDLEWLVQSDVVVAEVTVPALGVGYEIGRAVEKKKRILCLYRTDKNENDNGNEPQNKNTKKLSAMISGCPEIINAKYTNLEQAKRIIDVFCLNYK